MKKQMLRKKSRSRRFMSPILLTADFSLGDFINLNMA